MEEMAKSYDPNTLEPKVLEQWIEGSYYRRSKGNVDYTVVIPPPNVTGVLHMGHALNNTIQDTLVRKHRMQGYSTRWIVGTDHAGIATQTKVDQALQKQGINRQEIGREAFIEYCMKWYEKYGSTIISQIKRMGSSVDFSDEKFTMSDEYAEAVRRVFVDWYHDGLIYQGERIVNWCPHCVTAIADDEVEYEEKQSHLWYLQYPLKEPVAGLDHITIATTRPETMLGDAGIAINPKHELAQELEGKMVVLPLVDREIPIFTDWHVDPEFGTGYVKVTPSHDPNDFAMGEAHNLAHYNIFDETAHVIHPAPERFIGMSREEAREAVLAEFEELGLLEKTEDLTHSVGHCYRCHTALEPWESLQWFVNVEPLKGPARKPVDSGEITFYPERWVNTYNAWMDNLKDWAISRQLWWGHRIPVFYCDNCGFVDASMEDLEQCPTCGHKLEQDPDVLDTWFSSQLFTFATQGWPQTDEELKDHHPTAFLSTAPDIIALWVARMIMASEYFLDEIPFHDVVIHPVVLAADGSRMSKSKGNGIDPIDLINTYGADAMRFGLLSQVTGSQSIKFNTEAIVAPAKNFANKIWNAARFVLMNMDGYTPGKPLAENAVDQWIFTELAELNKKVDLGLDEYRFSDVSKDIYYFFWNEFCDWYIEFAKPRLQGEDRLQIQRNLVFVLDKALRLLHPAMPFVTEEIWQHLPLNDEAAVLMLAKWPTQELYEGLTSEDARHSIELVTAIASAVRATRARYNILNKQALDVLVFANKDDAEKISAQADEVKNLVNIAHLEVASEGERPGKSAMTFSRGLEIFVKLEGLVDFEAEKKRLQKQIDEDKAELAKIEKRFANPNFMNKAKPEIIAKDQAHAEELRASLASSEAQLEGLN
ncbi:MAG: valine--tRNA ligase [Coriobacteriia bacterium]|nr:valine--tRNA ligase [Coriobacteriia bacterium]